jgi:2-methylcitrate dehydratase PrpD
MGRLVAETSAESIPADVLLRAKVSLVHDLSMALASRHQDNVAHLMAKTYWRLPSEASLLLSGTRVSVEGAAFANAALINARSQDDTHAGSTSHPGCCSIATALAMAEAMDGSGSDFLVAMVLGYEVLCRIGRDFDQLMTARGFRAAAVLGGFGATAAAARLMSLSASQTSHALALTANLAGGLAQVWREGSAEGPLQMAFAARNGISAARAAAAGATAAAGALDGEAGMYQAFAGASGEPSEALHGIGRDWQLREVTVKPYPVCAILQGPVWCLLDLMKRHAIETSTIADIILELSPYEAAYPGIDNAGPFASAIATKMSAQFSLALAIIDGRIRPEGLMRIADSAILALAGRVRVVAAQDIVPRLCRLTVRLASGRSVAGSVDKPIGQPDYDDIADFARSMAAEIGTSDAAIDRLVNEIAGLERAPTIHRLVASVLACQ